MDKKVLIHGATTGSNFGDLLFANIFYDECKKIGFSKVDFLQAPYPIAAGGIGDFYRENLDYQNKITFHESYKYNALILMSGGYFGEDEKSFIETMKRYIRYVLPTELLQYKSINTYIIGVGGGPVYSKWLRKRIVKVMNKSKVIYVRDQETEKYFKSNGVKSNIIVTTDTALLLTKEMIDKKNSQKFFLPKSKNKKLFLHIRPLEGQYKVLLTQIIIPALNSFLKNHQEYEIVLGSDSYIKDFNKLVYEIKKILKCKKIISIDYSGCWKLCKVIDECDFIYTTKLHVGIVASVLGKSVVATPRHRYKVERFYKQIGENERCINSKDINKEVLLNLLEKFYNKNITIDAKIKEKAKKNIEVLREI